MKVLVTGGGGFLGAAITRRLIERGDAVVALGRNRYPEVEALGAQGLQWDLARDRPGLADALAGVDAVVHTAARAGVWGPRDDFWSINVDGTRRLVEACQQAGVGRLVFTGSPSCTFDGGDHAGATEADCPYPETFLATYPESKAAAERLVTGANAPALATVSLRPHLIWGPGDPHLLPRVITRNRQGRLAVVGDGENKVGITYVENAAAAHLQALDALAPGAACAGKAYFITDPEPVALWPWINGVLEKLGEPTLSRKVPYGLARTVGGVLEGAWELFGLSGEPPMTRFVAAQLATSHWYNLAAARSDFGYAPVVGPEEGMERMLTDLKARFCS
jgi:nucleoside-diphosphate-sugar epimerase